MASPDESRVDEARDQSGAPASPDPTTNDPAASPPRLNGGSAADEPSEAVSPGRPRGTASFPGGAPPVTTAPAEVAGPSAPPTPAAPARFRVTTVEPTAASWRSNGRQISGRTTSSTASWSVGERMSNVVNGPHSSMCSSNRSRFRLGRAASDESTASRTRLL